ncbi:DUF190 domain-containing protein [Streptomyces sp. NPDC051105]|uniref:DUF190 domain-containing protein n=1 Tax=Streptomyces sp. NPDC051105 TaxID=3154843 RepID=UPI00342EA772
MTRLTGRALRLTVRIGEDGTWHHKPLLSEDLPVTVGVVDTEERIRAFLPQLDELVTEGLVTLDGCEVIRYVGRDTKPSKTDLKGKKSL